MLIINKAKYLSIDENGLFFYDSNYKKLHRYTKEVWECLISWYEEPKNEDDFPDIKLSQDELEALIIVLKQNNILKEFHEVDEVDEKMIRLNNFYETYGSTTFNKVFDTKILIIGCGTVGSGVVQSLVKMGFTNFCLIDFDKVEMKNVIAQTIFENKDVGKEKVEVIKGYIEQHSLFLPNIVLQKTFINTIQDFITIYKNYEADFIIDCSDTKTKELVTQLIKFIEIKKKVYLSTGYSTNKSIVYKVSDDFSNFRNYTFKNWEHFEKSLHYPSNRGTIIDSQLLGSIITRIIVNHIYKLAPLDQLLEINLLNMSTSFVEYHSNREKFQKNLAGIFEKTPLKNITNQKEKIINFAQYLKFINNIQLDTTYLSTDITTSLAIFSEQFAKRQKSLTNTLSIPLPSNFYSENQLMKYFADYSSQEYFYIFATENKTELLKSFSISLKNYFSSLSQRDKELLSEIKNLSEENYHTINTDDKEKIDYFDYKPEGKVDFGSDEKCLDFIHCLLLQNNQRFSKIFDKLLEDNHINLEISKDIFGKTLYITSLDEHFVYSTFDNSYDAVITLLHELGHCFTNYQLDKEFYLFQSNSYLNEGLANQFLVDILDYKISEHYQAELNQLKKAIYSKFYREVTYHLDQLIFLTTSYAFMEKNVELTETDYLRLFNAMKNLHSNISEYTHGKLFEYNYLLNIQMYMGQKSILHDFLETVNFLALDYKVSAKGSLPKELIFEQKTLASAIIVALKNLKEHLQ
ncbi:ThiF family adenylyltransferase [Lactococcus nasutitermitis]|uniref:ThiF family adenylyltransferase n=1 Tax=Lactococcus nasutitermitis TaxID=1652957 RepID=A0ABV9JFJ8_9LACT|nr:ThiF family adenylyltransferase [Lactococcus nasutitermitis]